LEHFVDGVFRQVTAQPDLLPDTATAEITILPRERDEAGRGLYPESTVTIVKELRSAGFDAAYADAASERLWIGEKSAQLLGEILIGLGVNATWAGIVWLVRRHAHGGRIRVTIARARQENEVTSWQWISAEGPAADIAHALEQQQSLDGENS
jgi:hypothetical protein